MAWDFETDPEYQEKLDWVDAVRPGGGRAARPGVPAPAVHAARGQAPRGDRPAEGRGAAPGAVGHPPRARARRPGLRPAEAGAAQRDPGPLVSGRRSSSAARRPTPATPRSSPTTAPPEQKERYLQPLLNGECFSSYSMTEPHAGADPTLFTTQAVKDGDEWVINGWKFFSSNAKTASFLIVMAVTNPDVSPYKGMSMFLVPDRHARRQHRAQRRPLRRAGQRGLPRAHPLRGRARARGGAARRRGPGLRHRPDPPRRRAHPPRHAHHRHGPEGDRHDVRAGAEPGDRRAACWPTSSSCRATSPTPTPS